MAMEAEKFGLLIKCYDIQEMKKCCFSDVMEKMNGVFRRINRSLYESNSKMNRQYKAQFQPFGSNVKLVRSPLHLWQYSNSSNGKLDSI